jgi:TPR repeat protein
MEAAQLKYPLALFKVGQCLQRGVAGFTKDEREAFNFFNEAASRGNAEAMFELSGVHLMGNKELAIVPDTAEAFRRAKESADLGYSKAQYGVGVYCEQGIGLVKPDAEASIDWYFKAAKQGDKKAIEKLKRAGKSVPKSAERKKGSFSFFRM